MNCLWYETIQEGLVLSFSLTSQASLCPVQFRWKANQETSFCCQRCWLLSSQDEHKVKLERKPWRGVQSLLFIRVQFLKAKVTSYLWSHTFWNDVMMLVYLFFPKMLRRITGLGPTTNAVYNHSYCKLFIQGSQPDGLMNYQILGKISLPDFYIQLSLSLSL